MMKTMNRRTVLRGLGTAISLPLLEAMVPSASWAQAADHRRLVLIWQANGFRTTGSIIGRHLTDELSSHHSFIRVIHGLSNPLKGGYDRVYGDSHIACTQPFFTGRPYQSRPGGHVSPQTFDHRIANQFYSSVPYPSYGFSAYPWPSGEDLFRNFSYSNDNQPLGFNEDPADVLRRWTMAGPPSDQNKRQSQEMTEKKNILDFVLPSIKELNRKLGSADRQQLEQYLTGLESIHSRALAGMDGQKGGACDMSVIEEKLSSGLGNYEKRLELMYDLMALAMECDISRVLVLTLGEDGTNFSGVVPELIGSGQWHRAAHLDSRESASNNQRKIDTFLVSKFNYFLNQISSKKDALGKSLLERSLAGYLTDMTRMASGDPHYPNAINFIFAGEADGLYPRNSSNTFRQINAGAKVYDVWLTLMKDWGMNVNTYNDGTRHLNLKSS